MYNTKQVGDQKVSFCTHIIGAVQSTAQHMYNKVSSQIRLNPCCDVPCSSWSINWPPTPPPLGGGGGDGWAIGQSSRCVWMEMRGVNGLVFLERVWGGEDYRDSGGSTLRRRTRGGLFYFSRGKLGMDVPTFVGGTRPIVANYWYCTLVADIMGGIAGHEVFPF